MGQRVKFTVKGIVQGVGYRFFAYTNATKLKLRGYVRNLYNGDVEVVVVGDENVIEEFKSKLKIGPQRARVEKIIQEEETSNIEFEDFCIKSM
jgi:acylphosphatase